MSRQHRPEPLRTRPSVTVVIPCYNYGRYVATAVQSVLDQPGVAVDVIVIDDASTDGSAEVVRRLAGADARVRAILHERNVGHIATYNDGLEQATGDYVVLLSADDALTPRSLTRAAAILETHPSVGLVYGDYQTFADVPPPVTETVSSWTIWPGREWLANRCRRGCNCIASPEVVMRTSVQRAIGAYNPALPHSGDLAMWLRAAAVSDIARVDGPPQAYYRVHPDSMMRTTYNLSSLLDFEQVLAAFEDALIGERALVSGGTDLYATARKGLAASVLGHVRSACEQGRPADVPVDAYLAFALKISPQVRKTWRWRVATRLAETESNRAARRLAGAIRVASGMKSRAGV